MSRDGEYESWGADGYPLRVQYPAALLEEICAAAVEGLTRFRHGGVEIGGVLYGTRRDDAVRITEHRPLLCEYAYGPRFVLSERDRARMRELVQASQHDPRLQGLEAVGWYHSHTRGGLTLSPRDVEICDRYFPEPWQIAVLVQPEQLGPAAVGFFLRDASLFRTEVKPRRRAAPAPELEPEPAPEPVPVPSKAPLLDSRGSDEEAVIEEPAAPPRLPSWAEQAPPPAPSRRWIWAALAILLVAAAAFGVIRYWQTTAPAPPLALWVADVGGQLLIEWDRTARPIREAHKGVLEIRDGDQPVRIEMDAARLREGSVDYVRRAEIVDVRLRVEHPAGTAQELIRFVGPPVSRPASDEVTRERDALKAEVEKLRAENARLRGARMTPNAAPKTP